MSQFATEVRRGLSRRSTRLLLALAFTGIACIGVGVFISHESEYDPVTARAAADAERAQEIEACAEESERSSCEEIVGSPGDFVDDERFELTDLWRDDDPDGESILNGTAVYLFIGALIGGATFIGADWRFGTLGTLLTWEPRRTRVYFAKVAAAIAITFVVGIVLQALVFLAVLPSALWRGTTEGIDAGWWSGYGSAVLRVALLGVAAALIGFTLASIGRNTAAALGIAFAYLAVFESLVRGLRPQWEEWLLGGNLVVVVNGQLGSDVDFDRTPLTSGLTIAVYVAILLTAAGAVFFRRDVT